MKFSGNTNKLNPIRQMKQPAATVAPNELAAAATVAPNELPDFLCGKCECPVFIRASHIKKLSAVHPANNDPQRLDQTLIMEFWACGNCGEVLIIRGPDKNYKEREPVKEDNEI